MIWLPTQTWHNLNNRLKRRRRIRRVSRLLLILFLLFGLRQTTPSPEHALSVQIDKATQPYQFAFWDWESQMVAEEIGRQIMRRFSATAPINPSDLVQQFVTREQQIEQVERDLRRLYATSSLPTHESQDLEQLLASLEAAQQEIIPQVEAVLTAQVETILSEQGFTQAGEVLPPVAFRLIEPPTFLIISPRDKIERQQSVNLQPGLSNEIRAEIETALDARGDVSSYVTNIGGLGSYPTMVIRYSYLPYLIDVIIHEWTHNYLFTFPTNMAWGYTRYPRLRTINETTTTLVGQELSRALIVRYYPEWVDDLPPLADDGQPKVVEPSPYHTAMRNIRQTADALLAAGKIDAAEAFMETERQKLVEQGYNLRKLNQAYFAFHGSYALSPASVDPTGRELRQLRANSPSLKQFLERVGWLNSYQDYLAWLAEEAITRKE